MIHLEKQIMFLVLLCFVSFLFGFCSSTNHIFFFSLCFLVASPTRANRSKFDLDKPNDSSSSDQVRLFCFAFFSGNFELSVRIESHVKFFSIQWAFFLRIDVVVPILIGYGRFSLTFYLFQCLARCPSRLIDLYL